jgi:hypothetical protein
MDFIRQTVTLQISTPADDFEPSSWDWGELLELPGDMIQMLDVSAAELITVEGDELPQCRECGYTLRRDETDNWIDFSDGDVCYDDVQHIPMDGLWCNRHGGPEGEDETCPCTPIDPASY